MNRSVIAALAASCVLLAGCEKAAVPVAAEAAAVTEAEASKAFDDTVVVWNSMDAAKIKALYAPDVVSFDIASPALTTDRAAFDKNQDAFAAAKLDSVKVAEKKIQIVDGDTFIVSSVSDGTSSTIPANNATFRCTDVYHRGTDGKWWIVNENCSVPPKAA